MNTCDTCKYNNGTSERTENQYPCCDCFGHDLYKEYIGENLYPMKQYPIERTKFEELFRDIEKRLFYEGIPEVNGEEFRYWQQDDEFYILHMRSGTLINWYKHLGRCNTCNKNLSIREYQEFVKLFKEELDYMGY